MHRHAHIAVLSAFVLLPAAFLAGCRSPAQLAADADQAAARRIAAAEQKVLGRADADPFTVERPSDTLRRRLRFHSTIRRSARVRNNRSSRRLPGGRR